MTCGLQDPHVDPAVVHVVTHAADSQPPSTAPSISPFVTVLHEHTTASSGRAMAGAPLDAGRMSSSGFAGSSIRLETIARSVP